MHRRHPIPLAVAAKALHTQTLPARLNTEQSDGLNAQRCPSRPASLRYVLVTSTAWVGRMQPWC